MPGVSTRGTRRSGRCWRNRGQTRNRNQRNIRNIRRNQRGNREKWNSEGRSYRARSSSRSRVVSGSHPGDPGSESRRWNERKRRETTWRRSGPHGYHPGSGTWSEKKQLRKEKIGRFRETDRSPGAGRGRGEHLSLLGHHDRRSEGLVQMLKSPQWMKKKRKKVMN